MYLGTKANVNSDPQVLAQLGVAGVGHGLAAVEKPFSEWSPAVIEQLHEHYGKYGVRLEMLWLQLHGRPAFIGNLDKPANDNYAGAIWLGPSDERERALFEARLQEIAPSANELEAIHHEIDQLREVAVSNSGEDIRRTAIVIRRWIRDLTPGEAA